VRVLLCFQLPSEQDFHRDIHACLHSRAQDSAQCSFDCRVVLIQNLCITVRIECRFVWQYKGIPLACTIRTAVLCFITSMPLLCLCSYVASKCSGISHFVTKCADVIAP
jgi:hypothetical protein